MMLMKEGVEVVMKKGSEVFISTLEVIADIVAVSVGMIVLAGVVVPAASVAVAAAVVVKVIILMKESVDMIIRLALEPRSEVEASFVDVAALVDVSVSIDVATFTDVVASVEVLAPVGAVASVVVVNPVGRVIILMNEGVDVLIRPALEAMAEATGSVDIEAASVDCVASIDVVVFADALTRVCFAILVVMVTSVGRVIMLMKEGVDVVMKKGSEVARLELASVVGITEISVDAVGIAIGVETLVPVAFAVAGLMVVAIF